ncbi:MAG: PleD family two-component system response regulator [Alphaproteobacteria bacterium]|nr:PleD family two-component system response regulator [Alphaproteobacteria bacterium]
MTARILVVDDLAPNTRLLEAKLTHEYFDVLTASDGKSALKIVRDECPDIVLLDVMMPGMDGFEVCRRMKDDPASAHIPVVMVTALSDVADRVRGLEAGADDFLTKPINDVALLARVKSLVRLKMMLDELRLREDTSEQLGAIDDPSGADGDVSEGVRVVLIEDNDLSAERLELIAGEAGYQVERVRDCAAALEATKDDDVELTIVSLDLEDEDPLRLCSQMRSAETTRHLPVLLVIEDSDTTRLAKGLEIGANDYIVRPFDRQELLARMRTQVRRHRYEQRLRENYRRSISMALTDALTGLYNRRYFDTHFETQIRHAADSGKSLALLMLDLDRFKTINDTHGHNVGDEVLRETARRLASNLRTVDMVARFGGEEFAIVMPDTTPEIALSAAERLRARIGDTPFSVSSDAATEITVTTSIGLAVASRHPDATDLLKRADYALYAAKRAGRDTVHLFPEDADFTSATGTAA